jgi:hypothetical protein
VGTVCHADLVPVGGGAGPGPLLVATGPLQPGPCVPAGAPLCAETATTGSFTVQALLTGLRAGDLPTLRLPVADAVGVPQGEREVACPPVGAAGSVTCTGTVAAPGLVPRLGGPVELRVTRPGPTATATLPTGPAPLLPPLPPPLGLPVPPPPVGPPPAVPPGPPPVFLPPAGPAAEVPVIPEATSLLLLAAGLGLLLVGTWRRWRP